MNENITNIKNIRSRQASLLPQINKNIDILGKTSSSKKLQPALQNSFFNITFN